MIRIEAALGWCDVTHELEIVDAPLTFARPEGVGALQISAAKFQSGRNPEASAADLESMLRRFAESRGLGDPDEVIVEAGALLLAAGSFRWGSDLVRAWFVSDGANFAQVTYTCEWGRHALELPDCEQMVRTLRFEI